MTACLYCPHRLAASRRKKQTGGIVVGTRGLCRNCYSSLYQLIKSGKLTEAMAVQNGWMLPDTGLGRVRRHQWSGGGLQAKSP